MENASPIRQFFDTVSRKRDDMQEFTTYLSTASCENVQLPIPSSGPSRATISNEFLVKRAKKIIRIFASDKEFRDGGTYAKIGEWLNEGVSVFIFYDGEKYQYTFPPTYPNGVIVQLATNDFKKAVSKAFKGISHFIVSDEVAYRREYDPNNHFGVTNFNDPEEAKKMIGLFDKHFNKQYVEERISFWKRMFSLG